MRFRNRADAGRRLAGLLRPFASERPVVLGLSADGMPVAFEVARSLGAPLDAWEGPVAGVGGRTVILVDLGIGTGTRMRAAVEALRRQGPGKLILAVPVAAEAAIHALSPLGDELVVVEVAPHSFEPADWYDEHAPTQEEEVAALLQRARSGPEGEQGVVVEARGARLEGTLATPPGAVGLVLFAHGSGSSRKSPRNQFVARALQRRGLATLLFDLLTRAEEAIDARTGELRFDVGLLAERLLGASDWAARFEKTRHLRQGYFGSSSGAAAAMVAAAARQGQVWAVVSRGGRPDLAASHLHRVRAPTLLIVGGMDEPVLTLNEQALGAFGGERALEIIPAATHLFEEPGALEAVAELSCRWFARHLAHPLEAEHPPLP